ncbi:MAG TPA: isopentenyl-diphosphate Delta-isomerase [Rhodanobacteraceae bacterium]|nr:isopentenyl-diphosphate Delta-isomerase [Rhodanobacteraceae bacterium]
MAEALQRDAVVSSEAEPLILVDADDREIGHASKAACHNEHGTLHRAFSLFVFNGRGELLLQQRSASKRLWPGYWSNSCCSHPRQGEDMREATQRRLQQELGLRCALRYLYKFEYQADYGELGAEHELCSVFVGRTDSPVCANRSEVAAWRYASPMELDCEIAGYPERFTPWLRLEWQRLRNDFVHELPDDAGLETD